MGEKRSFWHFLTIPAKEPDTPQDFFARLPVIETPRLTLRKVRMSDAQDNEKKQAFTAAKTKANTAA